MGWYRKIIGLVRINSTTSKGQAEITLLKFLINDIQRQIKAIESRRRSLSKQKDKLQGKFHKMNEDDKRKVAVYEDEKKDLDECLTIFRKKLELTTARFDKIISLASGTPEPAVKNDGK